MLVKRWIYTIVALIIALTGCQAAVEGELFAANNGKVSAAANQTTEGAQIHFIDVGQGDAALILCGGAAVLIDAGDTATKETVVEYLKNKGIARLDYVVATHPHSDHIGGLSDVLDAFPTDNIIMPDAVNSTKAFERLLDSVEKHEIPVTQAVAGDTFDVGGMNFAIVAPCGGDYEDLNDYSVCIRASYGDTAFLFTGDAEQISEKEMLAGGAKLSADVLKAGHHGSSSSTTREFLAAVNPALAVISCGKDNSYGHPSEKTLKALKDVGVSVLRTDESGTVIITTDGENISVSK